MKILPRSTIVLIATFVLVFTTISSVEARTVVRSDNAVSVGQDQLIEGDLYTVGNIVNVAGRVTEDLLVVGTKVTLNGEVGEDVLMIGANVDVHGTVGDDVRVVGGEVIIAEPVLGDVFVIGGTVKLLSSATVTGDLTIIGGQVEVAGPVEGRVLGWVDSLRIDAFVGGGVEITAESLILGDNADISGDIEYVSSQTLVRGSNANVSGETVRTAPVVNAGEVSLTSLMLPTLVILFSVALWFLLSRRSLQLVTDRALVPNIRKTLLAIGVLLFFPIVIGILMVSVLGMLAGVVLFALMVLCIALSLIALPAVLAQFLFMLVNKGLQSGISILTLIAGTLFMVLCAVVPVIGPAILAGFFVLTFGAMIDLLLRVNR